MSFKYADREETYETGEAYYAPPGHTPVLFSGTEIVEFSPTTESGDVRGRHAQHGGGVADRLAQVPSRG